MKSPLLPLAALLALSSLPASAEIIGVDQFDYPDGAIAGQAGGTFWDYKNTVPTGYSGAASTWDALIATPQVTAGRLITSGNAAAKREYRGNTETEGAVNAANVAKKVYYRVDVTTGPSVTPADYFGISSMDFGTERLYFGKRGGSTTFGVEEVGVFGTNGTVTIQPNTTYTLVAQVDFVNDLVRLLVNPDLSAPEPSGNGAAAFSYTGTNWSTAVRFASGGTVTWDNLVVATTWEDLGTVVTTTTDEDNGSLLPTAGGGAGVSLREAVKYSPTGSLITFRDNLSGQIITLTDTDVDMEIPGALTIDASALPGGLTVSGNNTSRHFYLDTGKSLTLRGLTLTRGISSGGNASGSIVNNGTLNLHRCTFTGNASTSNGGAILSGGTLRATDCTFSENTASNVGGGVMLFFGSAELTRCTVSGNTAGNGGAIWQQGASTTTTLSHCTIAGNRSTGGSSNGGILAFSGTLTLRHCTVSQNTGNGFGGGLFLQSPATVNVTNSIIAGNIDPAFNRADIFFFNDGPTLNAIGTNLIGSNESVATQFPAGPLVGTATAPLDPKLSPLGYFGGPVQTMHPLIGSPAIDAAGSTDPGGTDARGFPRFVDGDANFSTLLDIGAVETGQITTVTTTVDENNGPTSGAGISLREALAVASTEPGRRVGFRSTTFPGTITLSLGQLDAPASPGLVIDASNITGAGVTISGNNQSRVFNIPTTATVAMHSLRIVNGQISGNGGGVLNEGKLMVMSSLLSRNESGNSGGGICNDSGATCVVVGSALTENTASFGGAILNDSVCTIIDSTLNDNNATSMGGGIYSSHTLNVRSSTFVENGANSGGGIRVDGGTCSVISSTFMGNSATFGGGINSATSSTCNVISSTLSGNVATNSGGGMVRFTGVLNVNSTIVTGNTPDNINSGHTGANNIIGIDAKLAPLGDYGGPTQTMPPVPGSPAIDAGAATTRATDQRGFSIVGLPDLGAAEYQGSDDVIRFWPLDIDGDGSPYGVEVALGTDPVLGDRSNPRNLTPPVLNAQGHASLTFGLNAAAAPDTIWVLTRSTTLLPNSFEEIYRFSGPTQMETLESGIDSQFVPPLAPTAITVIDQNPPPGKAFYRFEAIHAPQAP